MPHRCIKIDPRERHAPVSTIACANIYDGVTAYYVKPMVGFYQIFKARILHRMAEDRSHLDQGDASMSETTLPPVLFVERAPMPWLVTKGAKPQASPCSA